MVIFPDKLHRFELSVKVMSLVPSDFGLSFNQVGLCPVFVHPWNTLFLGRIWFIQTLDKETATELGTVAKLISPFSPPPFPIHPCRC